MKKIYDTVIIGGGPSGLSAGLVLSRLNRKICIFDDRNYRNEKAKLLSGLLTRDGIKPEKLRKIGRQELSKYENTELINGHVYDIEIQNENFIVKFTNDFFEGKEQIICKSIILATGLKDNLPKIEGLNELYGDLIHHCPICDSKDYWNKSIGIHGIKGAEFCLTFKSITNDITWFSDEMPSDEEIKRLNEYNIKIITDKINLIEKTYNGKISLNSKYIIDGLFLSLTRGQNQKSKIAEKIGLSLDKEYGIHHDGEGRTSIKGIFVSGDASKDTLLSAVGIGEGAMVAIKCNNYLKELEFPK